VQSVRIEQGMHGEVETIDATGLLSLAWRATAQGCELLFARTSLLTERLGLPGGVYDAPQLG